MVGMVVSRGRASGWRQKTHRNGGARRPGGQGSSGNIMVRLPQNHLTRGTALARPGYDFPHAGEPQINAVLRASLEFQLNSSSHAFTGSEGERIKLKIRVAESPVLRGGAQRLHDQDRAKQIET